MKQEIEKNCECCGKKLRIVFSKSKFCSSCSVYHLDARTESSSYKKRIILLDNRISLLQDKINQLQSNQFQNPGDKEINDKNDINDRKMKGGIKQIGNKR